MKNLKFVRKEKGLTQAQVGAYINRSAAFVCLVENGKATLTPEQISGLASSLEVREAWLCGVGAEMTDHEETRDRRSIGERLIQIRKEQKMTQSQIATRLCVSRNTISLLERNKIAASPRIIKRLVEMGVDETWLRTGKKESRSAEIIEWIEAHPGDLKTIKEWMERHGNV